jgi:hypothetical protein
MDQTQTDCTYVPLIVLIDGMERLAAVPSIQAIPEVLDAVQAFIADLHVMRADGQADDAVVNARMEAIVAAIERGGRVH